MRPAAVCAHVCKCASENASFCAFLCVSVFSLCARLAPWHSSREQRNLTARTPYTSYRAGSRAPSQASQGAEGQDQGWRRQPRVPQEKGSRHPQHMVPDTHEYTRARTLTRKHTKTRHSQLVVPNTCRQTDRQTDRETRTLARTRAQTHAYTKTHKKGPRRPQLMVPNTHAYTYARTHAQTQAHRDACACVRARTDTQEPRGRGLYERACMRVCVHR